MTDSTPPVLAALERAEKCAKLGYGVHGQDADGRLLWALRDALANQPLIACSENSGDTWVSTEEGCGWCAGCRLDAMLEDGEP